MRSVDDAGRLRTVERLWRSFALGSLVAACVVALSEMPGALRSDEPVFVEAARNLTADTRYPPGWPMLLCPWSWSVGAMQVFAMGLGLLLIGLIWWAAVKLAGWRAGAVAGVLILLSPGVTDAGRRLMSDGPAALFVVGGLVAILHGRERLAGVLVAFSGWVRLVQVAFVAALPRRAWLPAGVTVAVLIGWQLTVQGSVLGYSTGEASFAFDHIAGRSSLEVVGQWSPYTNVEFLLARMFGLEALVTGTVTRPDFLAPFVIFPAVVGMRRHWCPAARMATGIVALNLAVYLPYFAQSSRFVLPGGCCLIVFAAGAFGSERHGDRAVPPVAVRAAR